MLSQQKANDDLLKVYGKIIAIMVLLVVMAILGARYINTVPNLTRQGLALEHNRLLNVLAMIRSQWLASGRPRKMLLSWYNVEQNLLFDDHNVETSTNGQAVNNSKHNILSSTQDQAEAELMGSNNWITLSTHGYPIVDSYDVEGCEQLWQQLLTSTVSELNLVVEYQDEEQICRYFTEDNASLSYQLQTGRVIFLTGEK